MSFDAIRQRMMERNIKAATIAADAARTHCPHGCEVSPDRLREHMHYVHGPALCACGCGVPVPSLKATFASADCRKANIVAWEDARNALSEYKAVLGC